MIYEQIAYPDAAGTVLNRVLSIPTKKGEGRMPALLTYPPHLVRRRAGRMPAFLATSPVAAAEVVHELGEGRDARARAGVVNAGAQSADAAVAL
jgi:hypothetical protein